MSKTEKHPVRIVGAGPGDPELITVKGRRALEQAGLLVYAGSLVPEAVLAWAGKQVRLENSAKMHLDQFVDLMVRAHAAGQKVVRLHSGDPSLYGAIAEQIRALEEQNVPCEVIPGVTAAFAAAAKLQIEYTLPEICQTLIFTRMEGRTPVPEEENLADLAAHQASMAIYLSAGMAGRLQAVLTDCYGENAPVVVVYKVSHQDEKVLWTQAGRLAQTMKAEGITRQALVIAGRALGAQKTGYAASRLYDRGFTHGYRQGHE